MDERRKTGRNELCPCGSGKKYKKCHGILPQRPAIQRPNSVPEAELKKEFERMKAQQAQREKQQGLGRPIISSVFKGYRLVAVGNRMYWNKVEKWRTFGDFLDHYLKSLLGQQWADREFRKKPEERHPLIQWYFLLCEEQKKAFHKKGELFQTPVTGAIFGFITLAYNLYLIAHNTQLVHGNSLHKRLIKRLKNSEHFYPAFFETIVASYFIKAGFKIEIENESDSSSEHAEFVATSLKTKRKYSVEAKYRQGNKNHLGISKQIYSALKKDLPHERVVFINLNIELNKIIEGKPDWLGNIIAEMRQIENSSLDGNPAPQAYIFITNHPFFYNLESFDFPPATIAEGFKIPDFKIDSCFSNLKEALSSRERHIDMLDLMRAMKEYDEIPSTFDGEIPEYAFGEINEPRLKIGNKYFVPDESGNECVAELIDCCVSEKEKVVHCIYKLEDGRTIIGQCELSDAELRVYRRHPDTFFGCYRKQNNVAKDPVDLYDFFYEVYMHTTKDKLLEFLEKHPQIESFKQMPQDELAKAYCEMLTYSAM